jgi:ribosomal protein S18 acetylase RimI-like enzyme
VNEELAQGGSQPVVHSHGSLKALDAARLAWAELVEVPDFFVPGRTTVVVNGQSRIAPAGWVGAVCLGDAAGVVAPDSPTAELVRARLGCLRPAALAQLDWDARGVEQHLGPAALFFAPRDAVGFAAPEGVEVVSPGDPRLAALEASVTADEAGEAGILDVTSRVFVTMADGQVVSACGYTRWPGQIAHLAVLSHPAFRGRGLAQQVARAAIADAVEHGLLPQWRARVPASQAVARRLGLHLVGTQLSVKLNASCRAE